MEVMGIKPDLWPRATCNYMVKIIEKHLPQQQMPSIRLLLQIAVQYDLLIHHMDVKSAYLNAPPLRLQIICWPTKRFWR